MHAICSGVIWVRIIYSWSHGVQINELHRGHLSAPTCRPIGTYVSTMPTTCITLCM